MSWQQKPSGVWVDQWETIPQRKILESVYRALVVTDSGVTWGTLTPDRLSREGFESNVTVYACVMEIARATAGVKWMVQRETGGEIEAVEDNHPLLSLIKRPNPREAQASFVENLVGFLQIAGNSYIYRTANSPEMWILRPDRVKPIGTGDIVEPVSAYEYWVDGKKVAVYSPEDILHLRHFHPRDDVLGLSPLQVAARTVDLDNEALLWQYKLLKNNARPSGILMTEEILGEEQKESLEADLKERWQRAENAGRPHVLGNGKFTWQELSMSPRDLDWLQGRKFSKRDICQAFQVPPELIGDSESKTYANYQEARKSFYMETVLPLLDKIRDGFNNWLAPRFGEDVRLEYDRDDIEALQEDRAMSFLRVSNADWLSLNEQRTETGFDAVEDDDADVPRFLLTSRIPAIDLGFGDEDDEPEEEEQEEETEEEAPEEPEEIEEEEETEKAFKFFNLSQKQRAVLWKQVDRQRRALEGRVARQLVSYFRGEERALIKTLSDSERPTEFQPKLTQVLANRQTRLETTYKTLYSTVGRFFFNQVVSSVGVKPRKDVRGSLREMRAYIDGEVARKVGQINGTTQKRLERLISRSILDGKSVDDIVEEIREFYARSIGGRVKTLAETEVVTASNMGSQFGARATEKTLVKQWITQRDGRVRDGQFNHRVADSQAQPLDVPFEVSGEKLEFPGDFSMGASPGNVINCRCFIAFEEVS